MDTENSKINRREFLYLGGLTLGSSAVSRLILLRARLFAQNQGLSCPCESRVCWLLYARMRQPTITKLRSKNRKSRSYLDFRPKCGDTTAYSQPPDVVILPSDPAGSLMACCGSGHLG